MSDYQAQAQSRLRAMILGDNERAIYHPLAGVEADLREILDTRFEVTFTEDFRVLEEGGLHGCDVLIAYTDRWNEPVTDAQAEGLIRYVEQGGGLVVLHTGVSLSAHEQLLELIGARFTGHPPYQRLVFEPVDGRGAGADKHPIVAAIRPFASEDEPYRYAFVEGASDLEVILQYELEGMAYPAAWVRHRSHGRLVSLMPGHNKASLQEPEVRKLITSGCLWAAASAS